MMQYKNTKVKVRSLDGDTNFFDIVAGVLQGYTLALYLFIICLDYVLRTSIDLMKESGFTLPKAIINRYPAQTITGVDFSDYVVLLVNTPTQAKSQLYSLERAAAGIGLNVNADKTEFMRFNQRSDISTLNGRSLKLVNEFTYLGSSISSTENDINTRLAKARTALDRLSVIWKSDLTDKMNRSFFQAAVVSILLYGCTMWRLTKRREKILTGILQECYELYWTNPGGNTPENRSCTATYHPSRKPSKLDEQNMWDTAGEVRTNFCGPLHTDEQRLGDKLEPIYNSSVLIQDIAWKTCWEQWTIETSGEGGFGKSVPAARHDNDKECLKPDGWVQTNEL